MNSKSARSKSKSTAGRITTNGAAATMMRKSSASLGSTSHSSSRHSRTNETLEEWRSLCHTTTDATVIRSLRRRLWHALVQEDASTAYFCYTATRTDWDDWMRVELEQQRQRAAELDAAAMTESKRWPRRGRVSDETAHESSRRDMAAPVTRSTARTGLVTTGLLQQSMNPTDLFVSDDYQHPHDSYVTEDELAPVDKPRRPLRRRTPREPTARHALGAVPPVEAVSMDAHTTPLHEAVRLGHLALVQCMLQHPYVDCDARNGHGRSLLHCAAGGLTELEVATTVATQRGPETAVGSHSTTAVGIRAPTVPDASHEDEPSVKSGRVGKAARALGRWLGRRHETMDTADKGVKPEPISLMDGPCLDSNDHNSVMAQRNELDANRMDIVTAILRWSRNVTSEDVASSGQAHFDPQSPATEGVSINAVDHIMGRTALHYAAELGRAALCEAILQSIYGTMLTVIDCTGRTPCELAGAGGHAHLASYLEARALLFVDPYGTDEDLLAAMIQAQNMGDTPLSDVVPPFGWFETLSLPDVQHRRERRISQTTTKIKEIAARLRIRHLARKTIFEHTQTKPPPDPDPSPTWNEGANAAESAVTNEELDDSDDELVFDASTFQPISPNAGSDDLPEDLNYTKFEQMMHEGHVEIYLMHHGWNVKKALEAFSANPFGAFDAAGVSLPDGTMPNGNAAPQDCTCPICFQEFEPESESWKQLAGCCHSFCTDCLGDYLMDCAKSNAGLVVSCPHHDCKSLLSPTELAEFCPSDEVYRKLMASANDNYVVSSNDMRFCPHPGCGQVGAVKLNIPESMKSPKLARSGLLQLVGAVCTNIQDNGDVVQEGISDRPMLISRTYDGLPDSNYHNLTNLVQPKRAHRFCFQCGDSQIHWPVSCERLAGWKAAIAEQIKDVVDDEGDDAEKTSYSDVAQKLWMKANTRPCPQCKAPIQKNDGCNHMTCSNPHCKFEFCWICMCDWQLHNTETGGFFRCNRWVEQQDDHVPYGDMPTDVSQTAALLADTNVDPSTMDATYGTAMHESRVAKKRSMDMDRFLHHFARWNAHEESSALERAMRDTVCQRLASVVREAIAFNGDEYILDGQGLSFIHDAFCELVECRSMLRHSYAFSFFRYKSTSAKKYKLLKRHVNEKVAFEQFQSELELMTEQISDVVARSHIRATRTQIRFLTAVTAEKRKEFSNVMINILLEEQKDTTRHVKKQVKGLTLAGGGLDTIVGLAPGPSVVSRTDSDDAAAALVRESLQEFLTHTGSGFLYEYTSDEDNGEVGGDWACAACTYVNAGGTRCEMCATHRS